MTCSSVCKECTVPSIKLYIWNNKIDTKNSVQMNCQNREFDIVYVSYNIICEVGKYISPDNACQGMIAWISCINITVGVHYPTSFQSCFFPIGYC